MSKLVNTCVILLQNIWLPSQRQNLQIKIIKYMVKKTSVTAMICHLSDCHHTAGYSVVLKILAQRRGSHERHPIALQPFLPSKQEFPFQFSTNLSSKTDFCFCFIEKGVCSIVLTKTTMTAFLYGFYLCQKSEHLRRKTFRNSWNISFRVGDIDYCNDPQLATIRKKLEHSCFLH